VTETIRTATVHDAGKLAELAAATFPLACPPGSSPEDIQAHLEQTLSRANFVDYLADPHITILVLEDEAQLQGYTMLIAKPANDPDVALSSPRYPLRNSANAMSIPSIMAAEQRPG
jgi:hypothetical protein